MRNIWYYRIESTRNPVVAYYGVFGDVRQWWERARPLFGQKSRALVALLHDAATLKNLY